MAEGAVFPSTLIDKPFVGRSLWADARDRLFRNKAAVGSMVLLTILALACIFGPLVTGHPFDKVYPDYVKVPASLSAYPQADQIMPQVERIASRVRATVEFDRRGERPRPHRARRALARSTSGFLPISSAPTSSERPRSSSAPRKAVVSS